MCLLQKQVRMVIEQVRAVYKTGTVTGTETDSLTSNHCTHACHCLHCSLVIDAFTQSLCAWLDHACFAVSMHFSFEHHKIFNFLCFCEGGVCTPWCDESVCVYSLYLLSMMYPYTLANKPFHRCWGTHGFKSHSSAFLWCTVHPHNHAPLMLHSPL